MSIKYLTIFLLFISVTNFSSAFNFQQKLNNAILKAKDLYKKKFGKDKSWHFLGHDPTEYPGTNEKLRQINREKWEDYYVCLKKQEESLKNHGSIIPEAVLAFVGESVKFECKVCLSPSEREDVESVEWEWASEESNELEPLEITEHILVSPDDKTLYLYNLGKQQTGQYVCKLKNQLTAPYFLTIVDEEEPLKQVYRQTSKNRTKPNIPWLINAEIILDTMWGKWTPCSNCDIVGKRHRIGYCLILLLKNLKDINNEFDEDSNLEEINSKEAENESYMKIQSEIEIPKNDMDILHIFKFGVPCRAYFLPDSIKTIEEIKNRNSEIMTSFCKIKCPEDKLFIVKDKRGNIIETANNTAGIYSMEQEMPIVEPPVERRLQYEAADEKITLICPGNLNTDTPIQWQIGTKKIVPSLLNKESGGRIYVTIMERIAIEKARISDSNIYSCWQNKELAGSIRLIVEKRFKLDFNHHIMLLGIVLILSTFLYVFIKAYFGRSYAIVL